MLSIPRQSDYEAAFQLEREREYPEIDAYERRLGFAVHRDRLERAARVLACPVKVHQPCWQHGRVIYSTARRYIEDHVLPGDLPTFLDVGTAKGFSAMCARWAINDAHVTARSVSVDVIDPSSHVRRNTMAEVSGLCSLYDVLVPWSETRAIEFTKSSGVEWLKSTHERVWFAFLDGKHTYDAVFAEGMLLSQRQIAGDVVVFDDLQIIGVQNAVYSLGNGPYAVSYIQVSPDRRYAVGVRR